VLVKDISIANTMPMVQNSTYHTKYLLSYQERQKFIGLALSLLYYLTIFILYHL